MGRPVFAGGAIGATVRSKNFQRLNESRLNKCINIPCKRFRSTNFIGLKSVPNIVAGIHPWWLLAPLSERGGGGISAPGSPRKSPLSPPFPKGGIFASFRLINPENILFYLRLSAQICGLNNFSKRSVV
jgi:hypothetical protein